MSINKVSNQDAATLPIDKDSLLYLSELTGTDYATKKITVLALMGEVGLTGTTSNTIRYGADGQAVESDALKNDGTNVTVKNFLFIEGDSSAALYTEGAGATEEFLTVYGFPNIPYTSFNKALVSFIVVDGSGGEGNLLTIKNKGEYSELRGKKGKIHISDDYGGVLIVSDPTLSAEGNGGFAILNDDFAYVGINFNTLGKFGGEFGVFPIDSDNYHLGLLHYNDDGTFEDAMVSRRNNATKKQTNTYGAKNADIHTFKGVAKVEVQPDTLVDFDNLSYTTKKYVDAKVSVMNSRHHLASTNNTSSETYVTTSIPFIWGGSDNVGDIVAVNFAVYSATGEAVSVVLRDITTGLDIAEITGITSTSSTNVARTTTIANVPTTPSRLNMLYKRDTGAGQALIWGASIEFVKK
jgi:hypothetical protein